MHKTLCLNKMHFMCQLMQRLNSFIHSRYFYSAYSSPLLHRVATDCSIDTVSELTPRSSTGNCEWTFPRYLRGDWSGILTRGPPDARHRAYPSTTASKMS